MKVYFVTHSTSKDNEAGLASGWNDVGLSKLGIQQAKELGDRFKSIKLDLIYSSDLVRANETVRIAFGKRILVIVDKRLREINFGDFNGKPVNLVDPMNSKWIKQSFPNGESYEKAIARIHDFFRDLRISYAENVILIVGHRATKFGLDTLASKKTLEDCLSTPHTWQPYWEYELF
jgi:broad specificity phosphatase PhoE